MKIANGFFLGTCLLALQWISSVEAFFNLTSGDLLRTGQSFNLTVADSCTAAYTVNFGDQTPTKDLSSAQKIVSHSYSIPGNYVIVVSSGPGAPVGCKSATKSVEVRNVIQNMTFIPDSRPFTVFWRLNKTTNWTQGPLECKPLGVKDLYVMVENGVSVLSSECFNKILVVDFDFVANLKLAPPIAQWNSRETNVSEVPDESNYTFIWEFDEAPLSPKNSVSINCSNKIVSMYYTTANPDPGHPVKLCMYNQEGHSACLKKNIKIYDAVEAPIQVSHPNLTNQITRPSLLWRLIKGMVSYMSGIMATTRPSKTVPTEPSPTLMRPLANSVSS
ncbi:hypothetical protein OS493_015639 [Desmophyllum pertusum]|uniref:PKD domain-containing protein n=1 Tax=Desmophyllum pertusum TaxID=174260 RepID=A0A9X0CMQ3_9CNID|nr:hypothetical protein OS493_015639 [Desmophyllum pertusum]